MTAVQQEFHMEGERVHLRALGEGDAEALTAMCQHPSAQRWLPWLPHPYTEEDARGFIAGRAPTDVRVGQRHVFAVARRGDDTLVGTVDVHGFRAATAEVGVHMAPEARGNGMALEAVNLLIDYAFGQAKKKYLYWMCSVPNWASRKLAWKAGFRFEGCLRGFGDFQGQSVDQWVLSLAHDDPRVPCEPWHVPHEEQAPVGSVGDGALPGAHMLPGRSEGGW